MTTLLNIDIAQLRAQAHHLRPIVLMGTKGLTEALYKEIDRTLSTHALTKIQLTDKLDTQQVQDMCTRLHAHWVQSVGKTLVLYREPPEKESIPVKAAKTPMPRSRRAYEKTPETITQTSNKKHSGRKPPLLAGNLRLSAGGLIKKRKPKKISGKKRAPL